MKNYPKKTRKIYNSFFGATTRLQEKQALNYLKNYLFLHILSSYYIITTEANKSIDFDTTMK